MGILDRIGMIVRSNVNSMLEKSSNPEADLNMMMLDMQDGMKQIDIEVQNAVARQKMFEMNATEAHKRAQDWNAKAELAVKHNRDDLATEALRQKLAAEQDAQNYEQQAQDQRAAVDKMRGQLDELKQKFAETERNKPNLIAQYNMLKHAEKVMGTKDPATGLPNSDYSRMQQKIMAEEVRAEMGEQQFRGAAAEAELNRLQQDATLEDELAALKQRMGNKPKTDQAGQPPKPGEDKPYDER